jgi:TPP-dependent pyruvate/acetoin dehydrogenase alpha subunit
VEPSRRVAANAGGLEAVLSKAELHENPLVPNRKLRQMYVAMVEARVLDEHLAERKTVDKEWRRVQSTRGEEACRVSTAINLQPGDLVSDSQPGGIMDLLAGVKVEHLLRRVSGKAAGKKYTQPEDTRQLPWIRDTNERLRLAMGAALSLKMLKQEKLVVAYAHQGEIGRGKWRRILELASELELPIFFVVLPSHRAVKKKPAKTELGMQLKSCGVPGIVADANDAVALYRVAQETFGRIRGGGGPVFFECVGFPLAGSRNASNPDPVLQMKDFLLGRKVATEHWLDRAGDGLRRRIHGTKL